MIDRAMAEINAQYRLTKDFLNSENTFPAGELRQMRIVCRICEFAKEIDLERARLEAENAALKKHCEWLEQNLNLKNTVVADMRNQLKAALERRRCNDLDNRSPTS
jgi:hypothetical protein